MIVSQVVEEFVFYYFFSGNSMHFIVAWTARGGVAGGHAYLTKGELGTLSYIEHFTWCKILNYPICWDICIWTLAIFILFFIQFSSCRGTKLQTFTSIISSSHQA